MGKITELKTEIQAYQILMQRATIAKSHAYYRRLYRNSKRKLEEEKARITEILRLSVLGEEEK